MVKLQTSMDEYSVVLSSLYIDPFEYPLIRFIVPSSCNADYAERFVHAEAVCSFKFIIHSSPERLPLCTIPSCIAASVFLEI